MSNYITENDNWAPKTTLESTDSVIIDEGSGVYKFAALSNLLTYGDVSIPNGSLAVNGAAATGQFNSKAGANDYTSVNVVLESTAGQKTYVLNAGGIFYLSNDGTNDHLTIGATGNVSIPNGDFIVTTPKTPATAGATGTVGTIAWDTSYVYVCVATDTWKRSAIATW